MKAIGIDMGDYGEVYMGFNLEVAVEQVMTGVKLHFRVLRGRGRARLAARAFRQALDDRAAGSPSGVRCGTSGRRSRVGALT
jgi:hypothetical protein